MIFELKEDELPMALKKTGKRIGEDELLVTSYFELGDGDKA